MIRSSWWSICGKLSQSGSASRTKLEKFSDRLSSFHSSKEDLKYEEVADRSASSWRRTRRMGSILSFAMRCEKDSKRCRREEAVPPLAFLVLAGAETCPLDMAAILYS